MPASAHKIAFYAGTMFVATTGQKKAYYAENYACINIPSLRT